MERMRFRIELQSGIRTVIAHCASCRVGLGFGRPLICSPHAAALATAYRLRASVCTLWWFTLKNIFKCDVIAAHAHWGGYGNLPVMYWDLGASSRELQRADRYAGIYAAWYMD